MFHWVAAAATVLRSLLSGGLAAPGPELSRQFDEWALRYARAVIAELRASPTWRDGGVPIIYYMNGCAPYLEQLRTVGADVLGVDWRIDLGAARRRAVGARETIRIQSRLHTNVVSIGAFASFAVLGELCV